MTLFYILLITTVGSLVSLIGSFFLSRKKTWPKKFLLQMTAFSSGILLATSLLHLAPEAAESLSIQTVFTTIFISIVVFFVLERLVLWHHHHEDTHDCCGPRPSAWFVTFGDTLHNFLDGVLITGAYLVDPRLGLITAFAVAAHEIPQEIADFSIMVAGGMKRKQALLLNTVSAFAAVVGAVSAYYFINSIEWLIPYVVAFSAGMFLYVALSDLIPELHSHDLGEKQKWNQLALFFVGVSVIASLIYFVPDLHAHSESEEHAESEEHIDDKETNDEFHEIEDVDAIHIE